MKTSELIAKIKSDFHETGDLLIRQITINDVGCCFVYLDTLSDKLLLEQDVITPMCECEELFDGTERTADELRELLLAVTGFGQDIVPLGYGEAVAKIAEGDVGFFLDGQDGFCMFSLRKFDKRAIAEPPTSTVLKGPREGFIEEIKTNTALIRRRIKSPDLVFENLTVGRYSSTPVSIAYVCSVADPETVKHVRERLEQIDIDGIIDSAYVAGFLEERRHSLFKQIGNSEKPDVIAAKLLEGRIAVIVDGSPLVLTLPFVLLEDLQDGYDYYSGDWRATFARIFRLFGAALTVLLPAAKLSLPPVAHKIPSHARKRDKRNPVSARRGNAFRSVAFRNSERGVDTYAAISRRFSLNRRRNRPRRYRSQSGTHFFARRPRRRAVVNRRFLYPRPSRNAVHSAYSLSACKRRSRSVRNNGSARSACVLSVHADGLRNTLSRALRTAHFPRPQRRNYESGNLRNGLPSLLSALYAEPHKIAKGALER